MGTTGAGERQSTRRAGEIKGGLCAETRVSTLYCIHVVGVAWLQGKGCSGELREEEKAAKVKLHWAEGVT